MPIWFTARLNSRIAARPTALKLTPRAALAALLSLPCVAFSQVQAVTNQPVNLMAGPGDDYPVVTGLAPNQPVEVMGCVSTYEWCDVALDDLRGWVDGNALTYAYEGNYVPLESYGAVIGLPVIGFSIDTYWDRYYHGRPWYGDRDRWRHGGPPGYPGGGHPNEPPPHGPEPYRGRTRNSAARPQPNGGAPYRPPMQEQGQPVYRPNAGPVPHGGPPPQQAPAPQYGRPPAQAPRPQPQPQAQPQGRGQPNEGHREPAQPQ
jgi:uncharacterized protein YraI